LGSRAYLLGEKGIISKIPLIMDLISGILLAYDFFPKSGFLLRFHNWIKENLKNTDTNKVSSINTIVFNICISGFLFLMLLLWAWYKNSNAVQSNILQEIGLFAIGAIAALCVIILITIMLSKIKQQYPLLIVGLFIAMISLIVGVKISTAAPFITGLSAFVYFLFLFPFAAVIAGIARRALLADINKPFYIFAVFGLILFVASKIIEIIV
jgi:hypothetical protein